MAKLYFRHGTVGSAKTLNLLAVAHNYGQQGKSVFVIKPALDDRFGQEDVRSRAGLTRPADLQVHADTLLDPGLLKGVDCILVDEAQFLSSQVVDQLRLLTHRLDIPVICYGLRTDFRGSLFEGAKRLLELADTIEEIKTTCAFCHKKAIFNLKFLNGEPTLAGPVIDLGAEEKYLPACFACYTQQLADGSEAGLQESSSRG